MSAARSNSNKPYAKIPFWRIASALAVALACALILANLLYADLARREFPLTGRAGALLYAAAFAGFADEWDLYAGQQSAQMQDGQLRLAVSAPQTATWSSARPRFADFDARAQATASAGPIDNAFGLVFHLRERAAACDLPAVIFCGVERVLPLAGAALRQLFAPSHSSAYFAFLISSDGYYSLWQTQAGATKPLSAWIDAPQIELGLGASNQIRVVARGRSYRFFINGAPAPLCLPHAPSAASAYSGGQCIDGSMQEVYQAPTAATGKIGFIAQSTTSGGGGSVLHFDNLLVFSPAAGAAEVEL